MLLPEGFYDQAEETDRKPKDRKEGHDKYRIDTLRELKAGIQNAIKLELATIPPYLCALYSIHEGTNRMATGIIRSVVMEEMLHLCMAANLLNAIGGEPVIDHTTMLDYPGPLPVIDAGFEVGLQRFSPNALKTFLQIEMPAVRAKAPSNGVPHSIGQFYSAIFSSLKTLSYGNEKFFKHNSGHQITAEHYYGSGGKLVAVDSLETAEQAICEIVGQGEGIDGTIDDGIPGDFGDGFELAHYYRFNELAAGRRYQKDDSTGRPPSGAPIEVDWGAVYDMQPNPKLKDFGHNPELKKKALEFNKTYAALLSGIQSACKGKPQILNDAIPLMYELKYQAVGLMKIPIGKTGLTAGPTFEAVQQ